MKKHELLEAVIKLIGVYCFVLSLRGIIIIPMSVINFLESYSISFSYAFSPILAGIYHLVLIFLSYVLIKRTDLILKLIDLSPHQDEETTIEIPTWSLSFWIRIIGLYYFVYSTPHIASYFAGFILYLDFSTPNQTHIISDMVQSMLVNIFLLGLSLFFIFKNHYIEAMLTRTKSEEN